MTNLKYKRTGNADLYEPDPQRPLIPEKKTATGPILSRVPKSERQALKEELKGKDKKK